MSVQLSVAVMAHRRRETFIPPLLAALDRDANVAWDAGDNDRWSTGRRAMLAYGPGSDYHLVLQDDALVCRDLVAGVERALDHVPTGSPVSLYCGRVRPFREMISALVGAAGPGTSWLSMGQIHWGVGIVMPTAVIDDMVAWCDRQANIENYDLRISRWVETQGLTVYYPWPSLVDHRDSPSLVPGRGSGGRRAHRFLGADVSALGCDWAGHVVSVPKLDPSLPADQIAPGSWRVVGSAAHASVTTATGRAQQLFFRGALLTGVPMVEVRHLLSVGLIQPVVDPQPASEEVQ